MADYNRGDIAEGIVGAALTAKFINRPKSLKDTNIPLTKKMIDDVLDNLFKSSNNSVYKANDLVSKKGKTVMDTIKFSMHLPVAAFNLLKDKNKRILVDDLYKSSIDYIETTWQKEVLDFAKNGEIDNIIIDSDGVGDQKGTKADIKITINGKKYSRQISLKVKGGDQFAQVTGHDFSKQKVLWESILNLDLTKIEKKYNNELNNYDSSEAFSSREHIRVELFKKMLKSAAAVAYKEATNQIQQRIKSKNTVFFTNLTKLIIEGAAKGDLNIELVKLERGGFSRLRFDKTFLKNFTKKLMDSNLQVVFVQTGDPTVRIYAGQILKSNLILQIRPKVAAESSVLKSGKVYKPYIRNLIESGPMLFKL
jgi:hypothetical protein